MTDLGTGLRTSPCPGCKRTLTGDRRWPLWCPDCEWGLDDPVADLSARERRRRSRMHRRVLGVHQRLLAKGTQPRPALRGLAMVLAVLVHLCTLAVGVAGVLVWFTPLAVVLKPFVSALLVLAAVETRPRLGKLAADRPVLRRHDAPHLFALLDQVCTAARARHFDVVLPTADFNAATGFVGLRPRECFLIIGLPLWNSLDRNEKVALLGHEVGHLVNGDFREGLLVGTALSTLRRWQLLLTPHKFVATAYIGDGRRPSRALSTERYVSFLLMPLSMLMAGFAKALDRIAAFAGQRAEYRADTLAATIGGKDAALRLFNQFYFADATVFAMKVALRTDTGADIWAIGRAYGQGLPESERERVRRNGDRALHRTDASHPPTALRTELLSAAAQSGATVDLDPDEERLVDAELMSAEPFVRRRLVERMAH